MAKMGWRRVFAIDADEEMVGSSQAAARRNRAAIHVAKCDLGVGSLDLPRRWPRRFGIVLDRLVVNNFHDRDGKTEPSDRREYFARVAELMLPRGILILRDRRPEAAEATYRRALYSEEDPRSFLPKGMERIFRPLRGGKILPVRLVGDDTGDFNRLDAMIPIMGTLAVLRKASMG